MNMLICGKWRGTKRKMEVINPFNNEGIDTVPMATVEHVREALTAASKYDFRLTAWQRYEILSTFCRLLMEQEDAFAELISLESGKPIKESYVEIDRAYQTFLISAEEAKRIDGEIMSVDTIRGFPKRMGLVIREPLGVVVCITPFNFPLNLVAHKVGPALAANNPVVLKPSSLTPLTALKMAELFLEAGLPAEMLHVLTGDVNEIGDELVTHPLVQKVNFTGSVPVGKSICEKVGMRNVTMELGGNDPLIVLEDADLEAVVSTAVLGAFGNGGQRCTSVKRIIIERAVADRCVDLFVQKTQTLRIGDPMEKSTDVGPLITEEAAKEIEEIVNVAVKKGAKLLCGGKREGALYWPTVLDHVEPDNPIVVEETFGPVAPFIRVNDFEQAIRVANGTAYGLQSGIYTNNLEKALEAAKRIQAGAVVINNIPGYRVEHLPFGGVKNSGIGREGIKYAVAAMTRTKTIVL